LIVTTPGQLRDLVRDYSVFEAFAFDVETVGEHRGQPRRNEVFWISLAGPGRADVIPMGHPLGRLLEPAQKVKVAEADCPAPERCARCSKGRRTRKDGSISRAVVVHNITAKFGPPPPQLKPEQVWPMLAPLFKSDALKVGQNLKFDLESITKYLGELPAPPYADVMLANQLINENHFEYNLGAQVKREFDYAYDKTLGKIGVETFAFEEAALYGMQDARYAWLLWSQRYKRMLEREGLAKLYHDVEMKVLKVVCKMELAGPRIDRDKMEVLAEELDFRMRQLLKGIEEANGGPINLNADAQIRELVYVKRGHKPTIFTAKTEEPSTSAKALEAFAYKDPRAEEKKVKDPVVADIIEYLQISKIYSTYIKNNIDTVREEGRLYGEFKQLGTDTGRFSSSNPNLQNIPIRRGKQVRELFIAGEGRKLIVADYSQVELRILAHYTQDPLLLKAYRENLDLHEITARVAYSIPEDKEVPTRQRALAKNVNFSVIYMGTAYTIVSRYEVPEKEAKIVVDGFYKAYKKVKPWQMKVIKECRSTYRKKGPGQAYCAPHVKTVLGRKRRLPDIVWPDDGIRRRAERQAVNAKIQGTAADIAKLAMVRLDELIEESGIDMQLIMVIHDEFVVDVPEEHAEQAAAMVKEAMESVNMLTVPLIADVKTVDCWAEAK